MPEPTAIGPGISAYLRTLAANIDAARRTGSSPEEMAQRISPAEVKLLEALTAIGLEPEQQHPLGAYFADFFFPKANLCVEVDGSQHKESYEHDNRRDAALRRKGITTLRIPALTVFLDPDRCARLIRAVLDKTTIANMDPR